MGCGCLLASQAVLLPPPQGCRTSCRWSLLWSVSILDVILYYSLLTLPHCILLLYLLLLEKEISSAYLYLLHPTNPSHPFMLAGWLLGVGPVMCYATSGMGNGSNCHRYLYITDFTSISSALVIRYLTQYRYFFAQLVIIIIICRCSIFQWIDHSMRKSLRIMLPFLGLDSVTIKLI